MTLETYVVHVTKECNCNCHYCYETDKDSKYEWHEIKSLLDNFIKYHPTKQFGVEFLGGEPMMAFNYIKNTVEYLENLNTVNVDHYTITTNGTIVHDELVNLMNTYPKLSWAVSMDGTKFMNSLRVFKDGLNTHDKVIENFNYLKSNLNDGINRLSVHMVTHPFNIGYLSEGIEHLYNVGFRHIDIGTIESTIVIGKEYCDRFISELDLISKRLVSGKYPGLSVGVLEYMKPREDVRYYIKDSSGKTVGESYGRSGDDITKHIEETGLTAFSGSSPLGEMITDIREIVYLKHQERTLPNSLDKF